MTMTRAEREECERYRKEAESANHLRAQEAAKFIQLIHRNERLVAALFRYAAMPRMGEEARRVLIQEGQATPERFLSMGLSVGEVSGGE